MTPKQCCTHHNARALTGISHRHGLTQRQMLEQLITDPHEARCKSLEGDDFRRFIDMGCMNITFTPQPIPALTSTIARWPDWVRQNGELIIGGD